MKSTVAIIGSHPRTRAEFDMSRTDADVWLFNEALSNLQNRDWAKRADAVFQMHEEAIWRNPANRNDPKHLEWLRTQTECKVYMQERYGEVLMSERYPLDEIASHFKIKYFTSSVAYALALACYLGYKRIEVYGVEMETNTEYQYQRDGVTLWIGVALGLGIDVDLHMSIFDNPLYGYEGEVVLPYETFDKRIAELLPVIDALNSNYAAATSKMRTETDLMLAGDNSINVFKAVQDLTKAGEELGLVDGARQECGYYKQKADKMREAAEGEFLFSRQEFESKAKYLSDMTTKEVAGLNAFGGQLDILHRNVISAAKNSPKRRKLIEAYKQLLNRYFMANNQAAIYKGAAQENFRFMAVLDKSIRAAGGSKAEEVLLERLRNEQMVAAQSAG